MNTLATFRGTVTPQTREPYLNHRFSVPVGTTRLRVRLAYLKPGICQLYLGVFAPNGYRGSRMLPGAIGDVVLELDLTEHRASLGGIAGAITPGEWRAQLDLERTLFVTEYTLTVEVDGQPIPSSTAVSNTAVSSPKPPNGRAGAGWYRGELHSHTVHSDGRDSVAELVAAARHYTLDFLALTDHFTTAGWADLGQLSGEDLCLLRGLEITGHRGHANLHGLRQWINPFVDEPRGWSINDAARAVHAQGGLFCVNHAFALDLGWRYHDFDWNLCDLMEIYHHFEGEMNTAQLALWDEQLRAGRHITGVAGTDTHDAHHGRHRLGQVMTAVHASALEPDALIAGLRAGCAYVTLGPGLTFTAHAGDSSAEMGQTLEAGETVELRIEIHKLERPARLVVLKNGWYHRHVDMPAAPKASVKLRDVEPLNGYYRVELYALPAQPQPVGVGRDWAQTLLLSNPIYVHT
jgi:hypothetical protein